MKIVQFKIDEKDEQMLLALKSHAKSPARSKIFKFCLRKTYALLGDVRP